MISKLAAGLHAPVDVVHPVALVLVPVYTAGQNHNAEQIVGDDCLHVGIREASGR